MTSNMYLIVATVLALSSCASAFFGWGSTEQRTPAPQFLYTRRFVANPGPAYTVAGNEKQQIPAIPVHVPLQAELAAAPNIQNVELVPCLCPVSQDYAYAQAQQERVYVSAFPVQPVQQQQPQKK